MHRRGVYLVTTTDQYSVIGEYAGREGNRLVFVTGPLAPVSIPRHKIADFTRMA
jgi:hypothetical protein